MDISQELVSVIIPIYNVERYLASCLESLIVQSYTNLELILVDDGSTDQSSNIIEEYLKKDDRFIFVRKLNGGLSDARNAGIEIAKGKYLIFVDSDDYVHFRFVELLYKAVKRTGADIAVCEGIEVDEEHPGDTLRDIDTGFKTEILNSLEAMKFWYTKDFRNATVAWNKIYKSSLFKKERFDKGRLHEDEFIMHRLFLKAQQIVYIWEGLYFYYQRNDSITGVKNYSLKRLDIIDACEQRLKVFQELDDKELEYLHRMHYIDILLGCSADIMEKYSMPDKKEQVKLLKKKMIQLVRGKRLASKQAVKMLMYCCMPAVYVKLYRKIKR